MKKLSYLFIVFTLFLLVGCDNSKKLLGNWNTVALIIDGQEHDVIESNIKFGFDDGFFMAKGCAGENLYTADVEIDGKSIYVTNMRNTGFMGTPDYMEFENLFFEAFLNSDSYKISGDTLTIYNSWKNMELKLKKE